jgi:hypothetical protein
MIIGSLGTWRGQAIQNSRLRLLEAKSIIHGYESAAWTLGNAPLSVIRSECGKVHRESVGDKPGATFSDRSYDAALLNPPASVSCIATKGLSSWVHANCLRRSGWPGRPAPSC